ncbi:AAA family ATPase [Klebsiella pneumoniae]|uniref:AAA family ATPase n=1 Tax=Klebsiella pneumoniae TaxID=573 RepID=UPI003987067A
MRRLKRYPTPFAAAAPGCPIRTGRLVRSCSSVQPGSVKPSCVKRWLTLCSTATTQWCVSICPEFMEKHSVSRLVGAPPGYVGYEEGGYLTEAVRRRPYSVILLDEVEKAHPDVFNILLQVLDDGRLTDGQGRTVDFRNTVVIMTSNLGSDLIQERFGELDYGHMKDLVLGVVSQNFRPEFINRIDEVVVFHPLGEKHIASIAQIQLQRLYKRLEERGYEVQMSDEALKLLSANGYDPVYGARPLKRAIQQQIENPLAQQILSGELVPGKTIELVVKDDRIVAVQ